MAVADIVVKQEAVGAVDLEERICDLCRTNPKGISDQLIQQDMPGIPPQQRVTAINRLLSIVSSMDFGPVWFIVHIYTVLLYYVVYTVLSFIIYLHQI